MRKLLSLLNVYLEMIGIGILCPSSIAYQLSKRTVNLHMPHAVFAASIEWFGGRAKDEFLTRKRLQSEDNAGLILTARMLRGCDQRELYCGYRLLGNKGR